MCFIFSAISLGNIFRSDEHLASYVGHARRNAAVSSCEAAVTVLGCKQKLQHVDMPQYKYPKFIP
jgi:hypothetical protein